MALKKKLKLVEEMCLYKETGYVLETMQRLRDSLAADDYDRTLLVCVDVYGYVVAVSALECC